MTHAICTVGYPGSQKDVAMDVAEALGMPTVSMGERVRERAKASLGDRLARADLPESDIIGEWASDKREDEGKAVVAKWTVAHVIGGIDGDTVLIDGLRSTEELAVFKDAFDDVTVIHIDAPIDDRLRRMQERTTGDITYTRNDLKARDAREDDWGVNDVIALADATVVNTEYEQYRAALQDTLSKVS